MLAARGSSNGIGGWAESGPFPGDVSGSAESITQGKAPTGAFTHACARNADDGEGVKAR